MRAIALNIETTGLSPKGGDRIVELAAIEVVDRKVSIDESHLFHRYIIARSQRYDLPKI